MDGVSEQQQQNSTVRNVIIINKCNCQFSKAFFNIKLEQVGKLNKMKKEGQVPSDNEEIVTDPMRVFLTALDNCRPLLKVTPIKKGGISYQVPVPMSETEREFRARKIIIKSAKDKDNHVRFPKQLAYELLAASKNEVLVSFIY